MNVVRRDAMDAAVHALARARIGIRAVRQEGHRSHDRPFVDIVTVGRGVER